MRAIRWLVVAWAVVGYAPVAGAATVIDSFESLAGWTTHASDNASVEISLEEGIEGKAMRVDFDIAPGGSFVIVRKAVALTFPKAFALKLWMRGDAPANDFQLKLVDRSGRNVWWYRQRPCRFPHDWRLLTVRDSRLEFAWGDRPTARPREVGFIELAIAAGEGGRGSFWVDELVWEPRRPFSDPLPPPKVEASTSLPGSGAELVLDTDPHTAWRSGTLVSEQWLQLDFQVPREYGALVIEWDPLDYAREYRVMASEEGEHWWMLYRSEHGDGGRDLIPTGEAVSRYIRIELQRSSRGLGYGIRSLAIKPYELAASPNQFFTAVAEEARPGLFPRYFTPEQTYWTVLGRPEGGKQALLSTDGVIEPFPGGFSLEPFVYRNGELLTWKDLTATAELAAPSLPLPSVVLEHDWLRLRVVAVSGGSAQARAVYARYELTNRLAEQAEFTFFLAVRPFQVLPPWQNLNLVGGVSSVRDLTFDGRTLWVNERPALIVQTSPHHFGAALFEEGMITKFLQEGTVPQRQEITDPLGYGSGALEYRFALAPGASASVYVVLPWPGDPVEQLPLPVDGVAEHFEGELARLQSGWRQALERVEIRVPAAAELVDALRASLGHILANRSGAALHPGPRTYQRAWIRDGASMATALLQMGAADEARAFVRWYAAYQMPDGRIPCCIDRRGADVVPEHDANGEFVFIVAEVYRYTRDIGLVADLWPQVVRAVEWIERARALRMTEEYRTPAKKVFFGLLPESISHEGYSAKPVHSYWDDFWALRGLKDAATLAAVMGNHERAAAFAALRDDFRRTLLDSLAAVMARGRLDFLPGSVELLDFDPNSTAIALYPVEELAALPRPAVERTFRRYLEVVERRLAGQDTGESYTPYELRTVPALIRLGWRNEAWRILQAVFADRRPRPWQQWPEILWRDPTWPRFIGDMPHAWISALWIEAVRHLFAYERESDASLVLGAGLPLEWIEQGVSVRRLPTHYGPLHFDLHAESVTQWRLRLFGDVQVPPGGVVLPIPEARRLKAAAINGVPATLTSERELRILALPAEVLVLLEEPVQP